MALVVLLGATKKWGAKIRQGTTRNKRAEIEEREEVEEEEEEADPIGTNNILLLKRNAVGSVADLDDF